MSEFSERKGKSLSILWKLLKKSNIKCWLDGGAVLGIIRDGDFLEWDMDIDISTDIKNRDKVIKLAEDNTLYHEIVGDEQVRFYIDNICIDVQFKYQIYNVCRWHLENKKYYFEVPNSYYEALDKVKISSGTYEIPNNIESYFDIRYGKDWRIPNPDFVTEGDDLSLIKGGKNKRNIGVLMVGDLFHTGHLNIIKKAKEFSMGRKIILGTHDDKSISYYKRKPIIPQDDRIEIFKSIKHIHKAVLVPFNSSGIKDFCNKYNIGLFMRGDDWQEFPGSKEIKELGIHTVFVPYTEGISTTDIINKCKKSKDKKTNKDKWKEIWK